MGKNRTIKIIGGLIAGMVAHAILARHTNRLESIHHLESEMNNYRNNISDMIKKFNWNQSEIKEIKEEALRNILKELKKPHFSDVKFPSFEKEKILDEIMKEMFEMMITK